MCSIQGYTYMYVHVYCALQIGSLEGVGKDTWAMSLYKLKASVTCTLTELST